jgi:hypothetical protein
MAKDFPHRHRLTDMHIDRQRQTEGFSIAQMPRKSAPQGVPINKFVMNEMGGTNPKPPPIKEKRTPANKRFHYEERTTGEEPKVKVSATGEGTHTVHIYIIMYIHKSFSKKHL